MTTKKQKGEEPTMTDVTMDPTLTAIDRCDRCGAQAYLRVFLRSGGELLFCAHHATQHREKLTEVASRIQDETDRLSR